MLFLNTKKFYNKNAMETKVYNKSKGIVTPYDFTEKELLKEIRKAENGNFYPIEQLKQKMMAWMELQKRK